MTNRSSPPVASAAPQSLRLPAQDNRYAQLHFAELRGLAHLLCDGVTEVTHIAEELLHRIVHPRFLPSTPVQHGVSAIASLSFQSIRIASRGLSLALRWTPRQLQTNNRTSNPTSIPTSISAEKKDALLAILHGVIGDHLQRTENPLCLPMQIRTREQMLSTDPASLRQALPQAKGDILLLVHGLCMSHHNWRQPEADYGEELAAALNMTPLYLTYNSGLPIHQNGALLSEQLEQLLRSWPVSVRSLNLVGFSMGGLIARSSIAQAGQSGHTWVGSLRKLIFLGSPHHGAPMERIGNHFHAFIASLPYAKAFARLGSIRSAGITDLRYGNLLPGDCGGRHRFAGNRDARTILPLPENLSCYAVAASRTKAADANLPRLKGDGLVPVPSALGQHRDSRRTLAFKPSHTHMEHDCTHLGLLNRPSVRERMQSWLGE